MLYFQVLLLTQEFEIALDYLTLQQRKSDATHFALTLNYYGALRLPNDTCPRAQTKFSPNVDTNGLCHPNTREFDFYDLLDGYVKSFSRFWPGRAADYYSMLDENELLQKEKFIVELILNTRNHNLLTMLVGSPYDSHKSILQELFEEKEYNQYMMAAAQKAQQQGESDVAITLYHCCRKYTHAMAQLNVELSSVLRPTAPRDRREEVEKMAREFARGLKSHVPPTNIQVNQLYESHSKTLFRLLNMSVFFRLMEKQNWVQAQDAAAQSRIVNIDGSRTQASNMQESIRTAFNALDNSVKCNVGLFLTEYMRCLYELYSQNMTGQPPSDALRQRLMEIRRRADIVFQHAVCIQGQQYQFSQDDQNKLMKYLSMMKL